MVGVARQRQPVDALRLRHTLSTLGVRLPRRIVVAQRDLDAPGELAGWQGTKGDMAAARRAELTAAIAAAQR